MPLWVSLNRQKMIIHVVRFKCKVFCVYTPYKESISKEMNKNNNLNLHLHDQMSGWLRFWWQPNILIIFVYTFLQRWSSDPVMPLRINVVLMLGVNCQNETRPLRIIKWRSSFRLVRSKVNFW